MAALIVEIMSRNNIQYIPLDQPTLRVGRALDNDVIVPDPSVSPHHLLIRRRVEGGHEIVPLAEENGIIVGKQRIDQAFEIDELPLELEVGRTRIRILDRTQAVAPTRLLNCRGTGFCLFGHGWYAVAIFVVMLLFSAYDNYLSTHEVLSWKSYWQNQVIITGVALSIAIGLLIINRLTSHRWDVAAAFSFTGLALLIGFLIDQITPFADYYFTSEMPGFLIASVWAGIVLPLFTAWFLIRLNHGNPVASWILIVILFSPLAYLQLKEFAAHYNLFDTFNRKAFYNNAIVPWDIRAQKTLSIDEYEQNSILVDTQEHL